MSREGATGIELSDAQRFDWLRLWRSENIGPRTFRALINRYGGARAALAALPQIAPRGRTVKIASAEQIEREFETARRMSARFIAIGEPDYPARLTHIDSAPPLIAVRGLSVVFQRPAVAIVGSRNASAAGLAFAERLTHGLADAGFAIVSGLARGIDLRAHQTSRDSGTVAVLAGGLDRVYPPEHAPLLETLLGRGAVLSEMAFGWEARGRDFPRRNRLVSGLANGVVIIEAARRSGSLITAHFAAEQGREVFSVPGSPLDSRAEGTNDLIRNGATLCTSAADVIDALAKQITDPICLHRVSDAVSASQEEPLWDELELSEVAPAPGCTGDSSEIGIDRSIGYASPEARLVSLLGPSPVSIDELARVADLSMPETRAILLELELSGRLTRNGGDLVSLATC